MKTVYAQLVRIFHLLEKITPNGCSNFFQKNFHFMKSFYVGKGALSREEKLIKNYECIIKNSKCGINLNYAL